MRILRKMEHSPWYTCPLGTRSVCETASMTHHGLYLLHDLQQLDAGPWEYFMKMTFTVCSV